MTDASYGDGETLTVLYDSRAEAEAGVQHLRAAGVAESSIHLSSERGSDSAATTENKGFFESLSDMFFTDEDRSTYSEGVRRGGAVVCVSDVYPSERDRIIRLLEETGAADLNERESAWREDGWPGYAGGSEATYAGGTGTAYAGGASTGGLAYSERAESRETGFAEDRITPSGMGADASTYGADETVPVVEENLRVGKREVGGGRVRIRSYIREEAVTADVDLTDQNVEIERRTVDRPVAAGEDAFRERSIEAEEHHEEAVVSKEARVVEEIGLRTDRETHRETISDTVRHTEVEIDRDDETTRR